MLTQRWAACRHPTECGGRFLLFHPSSLKLFEYLPSHQELLAVVEYCIYFGTTSNSPLPIQPSSINMKLLSGVVALGLLPLALANSILVTYPKDTPDSVIDSAKDSVKKAVCFYAPDT